MLDGEMVKKQLKWLKFQFPWQSEPKDNADKMFNAINVYCDNALLYIQSLEAELKGKNEID